MKNNITKEFQMASLLKFAFPSIIMMLFMSLYTMIDGFFVSRFVDTNALAAINIVFPFISLMVGVGIMFGSGGSALIAKKIGEGREQEAREDFTLIVCAGIVASLLLALFGFLFLEPMLTALGASTVLLPYCRSYFIVILIGTPAYMLQLMFESLFVTAGHPKLGLFTIIGAGIANMVLDYVFIVPLNMGIAGAAWATIIGYSIPAVVGILFFFRRKSVLYFVRPKWNRRTLTKSCSNGSSEMVSNIASAVICILFNLIMMDLLGESGVAAITVILYGQFVFSAIFLGFSTGVAPVISYNYGAGKTDQLQKLLKICLRFIAAASVLIFLCSIIFAPGVVGSFISKKTDTATYELALHGFILFAVNYLFCGANIYTSAFFTALSDGKRSALISFMRTFVLILPGLLLLPALIGVDGVWLAIPLAEGLGFLLSVGCLVQGRKKYRYTKKMARVAVTM